MNGLPLILIVAATAGAGYVLATGLWKTAAAFVKDINAPPTIRENREPKDGKYSWFENIRVIDTLMSSERTFRRMAKLVGETGVGELERARALFKQFAGEACSLTWHPMAGQAWRAEQIEALQKSAAFRALDAHFASSRAEHHALIASTYHGGMTDLEFWDKVARNSKLWPLARKPLAGTTTVPKG